MPSSNTTVCMNDTDFVREERKTEGNPGKTRQAINNTTTSRGRYGPQMSNDRRHV